MPVLRVPGHRPATGELGDEHACADVRCVDALFRHFGRRAGPTASHSMTQRHRDDQILAMLDALIDETTADAHGDEETL